MRSPRAWGAAAAVAALTVREALRSHLWAPFLGATILLVGAIAAATGVDPSSRLKLAVEIVGAGVGFVGMLMAMLIASAQLRRDLDARVAVMLFSKPLPKLMYLVGRSAGVIIVLLVGLALMAAIASLAVRWRYGATPEMRTVFAPASWSRIAATGELVPIPSDHPQVMLAGLIGDGVEFGIAGLPAAASHELLLRADVRSTDPSMLKERVAAQVLASADGASWTALAVTARSPYGQDPERGGRVLLRGRDASCQDLSVDYCRLALPASLVAADGSVRVRVLRLDPTVGVVLDRDTSLAVAADGGSFLANLERGVLIELSEAWLLCAFTMLVAVASNLPVALLGGLTLLFSGNALWALRDTLAYGESSQAVDRLIKLALVVLPDFSHAGVSAALAGGRAVPWSAVGDAWLSYGAYGLVLLGVAWAALCRREL